MVCTILQNLRLDPVSDCFFFHVQESTSDLLRTQELSTIPPTPAHLPADTSITSTSASPVLDPATVESMSNTPDLLVMPQDSSPHVVALFPKGVESDAVQLSVVTCSRSPDESPSSIVLESPQAQVQTGLGVPLI